MNIPTSLEIPEETGVCNFRQNVARVIVYPSNVLFLSFGQRIREEDSFSTFCSHPHEGVDGSKQLNWT